MGNLVFQATLGGQVNLVGPNTASTFNLNVPAVAGTLITSGDSATVTNTMLAGSIANAKLLNSSVTVGSTAIALGASSTTLAGLTSVTTSALTDSGLTSGRVTYASTGGLLADSANLTFNGTTLTTANDASISGLTVGKGGGAIGTNAVLGNGAFSSNSSGAYSVAVGYLAAPANTSGEITAVGAFALQSNTTGNQNTAVGVGAIGSNTTGNYNVALGRSALTSNTTASNNTAVGYQAGYSNTTGTGLTVLGYQAGYTTTTKPYNTIIGYKAGSLSTAAQSTFIGYQAGYYCSGISNTFVGPQNDSSGQGSGELMTTGNYNSILGAFTGNQNGLDIRTASNYIVLSDGVGNPRAYWDNNGYMVSIGVYNNTTATSANVFVASNGYVLRATSALKYKTDVRDLESIDINKFRPVRYKSKSVMDDPTKDHFGVIADEVDQAGIKELVTYGETGEVEGFQYERLTVVLLKAVQELKTIVDTQAAEIAELKAKVA